MKVAFFKGTHPGLAAIYCVGVRKWTKSKYSHCEIIFSDGMSASSSFIDGGVRFARLEYNDDEWDFIEIPKRFEVDARKWFEAHLGQKYDILGNIHFIVGAVGDDKSKWFCSESIGAALGISDPWRCSPGDLYILLQFFIEHSLESLG